MGQSMGYLGTRAVTVLTGDRKHCSGAAEQRMPRGAEIMWYRHAPLGMRKLVRVNGFRETFSAHLRFSLCPQVDSEGQHLLPDED